ncbi:MAG TPA: hypothetical protein VNW04_15170 [Puia sp.]|jgi:hypothetical protein|nr:hypothetical protein [Puia sp.]
MYNVGKTTNYLATHAFRRIFARVDKEGVKRGVDKMGLNGYIRHCARLAATTGVVSGMGGAMTMILGVPADMLNNLTQQFRVTTAVIYDKTGEYEIGFDDFMSIVAVSIGVEAGVLITKSVLTGVAERLLVRMSEKTAARLVPFLGAAIGGTTNYLFIKGIGAAVSRAVVKRAIVTAPERRTVVGTSEA